MSSFEEVNALLTQSDEKVNEGHFVEAIQTLREALELAIEVDGDQTPDIAHIKNKLADALYQSGAYEEAEKVVREALELIQDIFDDVEGEERYLILFRSRTLLGTLHREQGRYDKAERELKRVLQESIEIYGEEHEQTSDAMNNLAIVYKYTAKFD
jgi:tetratricopeptide (TPR) repeat protein